MKMAHAPPGHHSVVGRPSVGGLSFPEYVVYRGEQVKQQFIHTAPKWTNNIHIHHLFQAYPEYLICYQIVKPEANSDEGSDPAVNP